MKHFKYYISEALRIKSGANISAGIFDIDCEREFKTIVNPPFFEENTIERDYTLYTDFIQCPHILSKCIEDFDKEKNFKDRDKAAIKFTIDVTETKDGKIILDDDAVWIYIFYFDKKGKRSARQMFITPNTKIKLDARSIGHTLTMLENTLISDVLQITDIEQFIKLIKYIFEQDKYTEHIYAKNIFNI
jgi:hypothetical protein